MHATLEVDACVDSCSLTTNKIRLSTSRSKCVCRSCEYNLLYVALYNSQWNAVSHSVKDSENVILDPHLELGRHRHLINSRASPLTHAYKFDRQPYTFVSNRVHRLTTDTHR